MDIIPKTFDDFLMDKYMADNPCVLDDDIADGFDDWICEQDVGKIIEWAEMYAGYRYKQGRIDGLNNAHTIMNDVLDKI